MAYIALMKFKLPTSLEALVGTLLISSEDASLFPLYRMEE